VETVPVPVFGTVRFVRTSAFGGFTCAVTESAAAYCWGVGVFGELGYGLQESSSIPVRVIAP
jgi:hypothetical protein